MYGIPHTRCDNRNVLFPTGTKHEYAEDGHIFNDNSNWSDIYGSHSHRNKYIHFLIYFLNFKALFNNCVTLHEIALHGYHLFSWEWKLCAPIYCWFRCGLHFLLFLFLWGNGWVDQLNRDDKEETMRSEYFKLFL